MVDNYIIIDPIIPAQQAGKITTEEYDIKHEIIILLEKKILYL